MNAPTVKELVYVATSLNFASRALLIIMTGTGAVLILSLISEMLAGVGRAMIVATFVSAPFFWAFLTIDSWREATKQGASGHTWRLFLFLATLTLLSAISLMPAKSTSYTYYIPLGFTFFLSVIAPVILFFVLGVALFKVGALKKYFGLTDD
ncbi:MAG: hypothetical protein AAB552_02385 [Patescibacteria group bacterium]